MKIKLNKVQWESIGKKAGWIKNASASQKSMMIYRKGDWNDPSMREIWDNNEAEWLNAPKYVIDESIYSGGYDEIKVEIEFDYEPEEKPSRDSPGSPETCDITRVIDPNGQDITNDLDDASLRRMEDKLLKIVQQDYRDADDEYDRYNDEDYWLNS